MGEALAQIRDGLIRQQPASEGSVKAGTSTINISRKYVFKCRYQHADAPKQFFVDVRKAFGGHNFQAASELAAFNRWRDELLDRQARLEQDYRFQYGKKFSRKLANRRREEERLRITPVSLYSASDINAAFKKEYEKNETVELKGDVNLPAISQIILQTKRALQLKLEREEYESAFIETSLDGSDDMGSHLTEKRLEDETMKEKTLEEETMMLEEDAQDNDEAIRVDDGKGYWNSQTRSEHPAAESATGFRQPDVATAYS
ncbi:hypothetical protein HKX48_008758 [Thoreauomyces humboldtii]|nr:hypothetical protein HKX48_008758 [Thoreauomyces humboldtii]